MKAQDVQTNTISYQGSVTTQDGIPISGDHLITATIYADASGTTTVWTGSYQQEIMGGIFKVMLGSDKMPIPPSVDFSKPHWVGIRIDRGAELHPLTQLSASPYSLSVPDQSITKDKLSMDYIASLSVNGKKITGKGTEVNLEGGIGTTLAYNETTKTLSINSISGFGNEKPTSANGSGNPNTTNTTSLCTSNSDGVGWDNEVAGGCTNVIYGEVIPIAPRTTPTQLIHFSTISGGENNIITSQVPGQIWNEGTNWHTIGGGRNNSIRIDVNGATENGWLGSSTIAGGEGNTLSSPYGFIGGGNSNFIANANPVVDDDRGDLMKYDGIVGGLSNTILAASSFSFIGGGQGNRIQGTNTATPTHADHGTIGGGVGNSILSVGAGTIGGGNANTVSTNASAGTIAGGWANTSSGNVSAVGGGDHNTASGEGSVISGGASNTAIGQYSTIAGGNLNKTNLGSRMSFIGGGFMNNTAGGGGDASATVGGSLLFTSGQNQVVTGWMNNPSGFGHVVTNGPNDDRIFEIGSAKFVGNNWVQNNAFEVSYNGHSIVYQTNGSSIPGAGGQPTVYQGGNLYRKSGICLGCNRRNRECNRHCQLWYSAGYSALAYIHTNSWDVSRHAFSCRSARRTESGYYSGIGYCYHS